LLGLRCLLLPLSFYCHCHCHPTATLLRHGLPSIFYGWLLLHLIICVAALMFVAALLPSSASSPIV
jgi:hypothetical protein